MDRNIQCILERLGTPCQVSIAYFDSDGYLIQLYCNETYRDFFQKRGIVSRSVWTEETSGFNAVTEGFRCDRPFISCGTSHSHPALKDLTIYFSPVHFEQIEVSNSYHLPDRLGGIALLVPDNLAHDDYLFTAITLTHDLEMTLHFNQLSFRLYERSRTGMLIVDTRMSQKDATVLYANDMFFQALNIPVENINFTQLGRLLKPEENQAFYELLKYPHNISDTPMNFCPVGGKTTCCTLFCDTFYQPSLNAAGIIAYISTPQMESRSISRKMGNTAVLSFSNIIGDSNPMKSAKQRATMIANTDSNVMILGESGVGKDVFAQAIHNASRRRNKPFIAVNCAALPRDLIASELFGYDSGAFTGAKKNGNMGKFELANGGTIFLDEIGDLPLDLQASLLRVVEQKQLMRLGSNRLIDIDVKIISATNADMAQMIEQRMFRSDLFFRLGTLKLNLPPLRKRGNDILLLANHFLQSISCRIGRDDLQRFSPEAEQYLLSCYWTGNVRELQNVMENLVQLYPNHVILPEHIMENISLQQLTSPRYVAEIPAPLVPPPSPEPAFITEPAFVSVPAATVKSETPAVPPSDLPKSFAPKQHKRGSLTKDDILLALEQCHGNRSAAAQILGITRKTLYRNMERLGMDSGEFPT
ncbi:sigma 54-interacting transcriptional regulator [Enterocloster bolteae]|nr:sigma 54-interacting transcriptional regulator [Enterocloster bolteae]